MRGERSEEAGLNRRTMVRRIDKRRRGVFIVGVIEELTRGEDGAGAFRVIDRKARKRSRRIGIRFNGERREEGREIIQDLRFALRTLLLAKSSQIASHYRRGKKSHNLRCFFNLLLFANFDDEIDLLLEDATMFFELSHLRAIESEFISGFLRQDLTIV